MERRAIAKNYNSEMTSDRGSMCTRRCSIHIYVTFMLLGLLKIHVELAAAQEPGFKSVDCGSSNPYLDTETTVNWVPDEGFISTGQNVDLMPVTGGLNWPPIQTATTTQLRSLRRFPEKQSKHCYTFDTLGNKTQYIVRATFYYSNDSTEIGPLIHNISFQLSVDSTVLENFKFQPLHANRRWAFEYIIQARSDTMYVCLIPYQGVPFINALELRPLSDDTYLAAYVDVRAYLSLSWRMNCGVLSTGQTLRYPDDSSDRYWEPPPARFDETVPFSWASVTFDSDSKPPEWDWGETNWNNPPNAVMNTAWDFRNLSSVSFNMSFFDQQGYFAIYVVNLNNSDNSPNTTRAFSWYIDDELVTTTNLSDYDGRPVQAFTRNWTVQSKYPVFSFSSTEGSVLGPILNAAEAYGVYLVNDVSTNPDDDSVVRNLKDAFDVLKKHTGDPCLPVPYDWLNCTTASDNTPPRITGLILSGMQLGGGIPKEISNLTALEILRLDGNQLTGTIPDLSPLHNLQSLHLENNRLSGKIPAFLGDLPSILELYLQNNSLCGDIPENIRRIKYLEFSNTTGDCTDQGKSDSISVGVIIGVVLGACAAAALFVFFIIVCLRKQRAARDRQRKLNVLGLKENSTSFSSHKSSGIGSASASAAVMGHPVNSMGPRTPLITAFTYEDIRAISNNFAAIIGKGGYGPVYRGKLSSGQLVAIKLKAEESNQGTTEFVNEVELLSRVHHKNILPLLGYCAESSHEVLVYQYVSNGTLHQHLHGDSGDSNYRSTLDWSRRIQIAQSTARGLDYLHTDAVPKICHRDVKSSNILLGDDFSSKVGDFGISKSRRSDESHGQTLNSGLTTDVKGSTGYLDPEYFYTQRLTYASDVYSFGVVLFEIITGKQPNRFQNLVEWAKKHIGEGNIKVIVDPVILTSPKFSSEEESLWRVGELAMLCTQDRSIFRPTMGEVAHELAEIVRVNVLNTGPTEMIHSTSDSFNANLVVRLDSNQASATDCVQAAMYEVER